jgi:hypothetical protein
MAEQTVQPSLHSSPQISSSDWPVQRGSLRVHLPVAVVVTGAGLADTGNVALLRDISSAGAFFYADLDVRPGDSLAIHFVVPVVGRQIRISCEGEVLRREKFDARATAGIAMQFRRYDLASVD